MIDLVVERREYREAYLTAKAYDLQRLLRKALYSFAKFKIISRYSREVIKANDLTRLHRYMSVWYELYVDCQGQKALFEIAHNHYLQKVFRKFLSAHHEFKLVERVKRDKRRRAMAQYGKSLATFALGVFKLFLAGCREKRLQGVMAS